MRDTPQTGDNPAGSGARGRYPNFTMPDPDQPAPQMPPADAAAAAGMGQSPYAPARDTVTAARVDEHGAPDTSPRIGPKLWVIGALVLAIVVAAVVYA